MYITTDPTEEPTSSGDTGADTTTNLDSTNTRCDELEPGLTDDASEQSQLAMNTVLTPPSVSFNNALNRQLAGVDRIRLFTEEQQQRMDEILRPVTSFNNALNRQLAGVDRIRLFTEEQQQRMDEILRPVTSFNNALNRQLAGVDRIRLFTEEQQQRMDEILRPVTSFNNALNRQLAGVDRIRLFTEEQQQRMDEILRPVTSFNNALNRQLAGVDRIRLFTEEQQQRMDEILRQVSRWKDPFITARKKGERLTRHGWFPHYTMPEVLLNGNIDDSDFNDLLLAYYRGNWPEVRQMIEVNLAVYPVDSETKAAFREALDAHESGLYRSVCRNLLPEVERVVRIHLFGGGVGNLSVAKELDVSFGSLPVSVLPDRGVGFVGYCYLQDHLYGQVRTEADRNRFINHQMPNRHAAIHGLIPYPSAQNSLNSIFVAEYVLQLISARYAISQPNAKI